jgi:hypothetical protein
MSPESRSCLSTNIQHRGIRVFEVLIAMTITTIVHWDVAPCRLVDRFRLLKKPDTSILRTGVFFDV